MIGKRAYCFTIVTPQRIYNARAWNYDDIFPGPGWRKTLASSLVGPLPAESTKRAKMKSEIKTILAAKEKDDLMGKGMDSKKADKKTPAKSMKEKKADKKLKKAEKK